MTDSPRDLDFGPEWLRTELPQPIASAWHHAVEAERGDFMASAIPVEVALRFVTALQVANLLADGRRPPKMLTKGFEKATLGSCIALAKAARDEQGRPFLPELARWPDSETEALLESFNPDRNSLGHEDMKPAERAALGRETLEAAVRILCSLDWLRRVELLSFVEVSPKDRELIEGRVQVLRSYVDFPPSERRVWRGGPRRGRIYLVSPDPHEDRLLDLDPFVRRSVFTGRDEVHLWAGLKDTRVILTNERRDRFESHPLRDLTGDPRFVHCRWVPLGVDPAGPTQPDVSYGARLREAARTGSSGRRLLMALGGLAFAGACIAAIAVASGGPAGGEGDVAPANASRPGSVPSRGGEASAAPVNGPREGSASTRVDPENPFVEHSFLPTFVDRFCAGKITEEDLSKFEKLAVEREVSPRALIAVFNVVGAFYRFEFKIERWLNELYYGAGAEHLPASCRRQIGAYRNDGEVPAQLRSVRDRVKRVWRAVK